MLLEARGPGGGSSRFTCSDNAWFEVGVATDSMVSALWVVEVVRGDLEVERRRRSY